MWKSVKELVNTFQTRFQLGLERNGFVTTVPAESSIFQLYKCDTLFSIVRVEM